MSKNITICCKIRQAKADPQIMRKAAENIVRHLDGKIRIEEENHVGLYSPALGRIDIKVENGQLNVSGFDGNIQTAKELVEQYYMAVTLEEINNSPIRHDETEDILLTVEV